MHGVLLSVQVGELLLLDDLGDRASGASVLASATGDAGVLVSDGSDVLELQNASGAGVDANATSDALVGINYGMSDARRFDSGKNIPRERPFAIPSDRHLHTVRRVCQGLLKNAQVGPLSCANVS